MGRLAARGAYRRVVVRGASAAERIGKLRQQPFLAAGDVFSPAGLPGVGGRRLVAGCSALCLCAAAQVHRDCIPGHCSLAHGARRPLAPGCAGGAGGYRRGLCTGHAGDYRQGAIRAGARSNRAMGDAIEGRRFLRVEGRDAGGVERRAAVCGGDQRGERAGVVGGGVAGVAGVAGLVGAGVWAGRFWTGLVCRRFVADCAGAAARAGQRTPTLLAAGGCGSGAGGATGKPKFGRSLATGAGEPDQSGDSAQRSLAR